MWNKKCLNCTYHFKGAKISIKYFSLVIKNLANVPNKKRQNKQDDWSLAQTQCPYVADSWRLHTSTLCHLVMLLGLKANVIFLWLKMALHNISFWLLTDLHHILYVFYYLGWWVKDLSRNVLLTDREFIRITPLA